VPGSARVDTNDELRARLDPHKTFTNPAAISNPADFNRDGRVDTSDEIIARSSTTSFLTELNFLITP
jgi:hypothetical protein